MWQKSDFDPRPRWQRHTQRVLIAGLVLAAFYVVVVFVERSFQPSGPVRQKAGPKPLSPDYWVYPPKSYVRSLADVRAWVGKPLWVRVGYSNLCTPGPETLGPIEKVVPRRAFERNRQVWLEFDRRGRPCTLAISANDQFFLDEIFLIKDPHEVYPDWSPEAWRKIEERRIEPGMTETQITFALGVGLLNRQLSEPGDTWRVMDYTGGDKHLRVGYVYGVAKQVSPLMSTEPRP